jgi:proteasome lid subunit RPN8/RPN11
MLTLGETQYEDLRRHGEETYPHEACGVLLGRAEGDARVATSVARCGNAHADSPRDRYSIDARELLRIQRQARARGEDIVGFYHSHPDHPARPSGTDLAEAHWLGCSYVITRVAAGKADATGSFVLEGDGEDSKRFRDEEIRIQPRGDR